MKTTTTIIFASIVLLVTACKNTTETNATVNNATLTKEVTESDSTLFSLLKQGKTTEALAMHGKTVTYKNIVDGTSRTYAQMDSLIKANASKNVKAYDYVVAARDFLIINNTNVLETVEANRKIVSTTDSTLENRPVILSILWSKDSTKWNVAYLHSSYKIEK